MLAVDLDGRLAMADVDERMRCRCERLLEALGD